MHDSGGLESPCHRLHVIYQHAANQTPQAGPHARTRKMSWLRYDMRVASGYRCVLSVIMCACGRKACLSNYEPACTFRMLCPHVRLCALVGFMRLACVCPRVHLCARLKGRTSIFTIHIHVLTNLPYDVCLPVGHQFYCGAHVRISIFLYPACISRWSAISPCPYCFIMTYFDYLSQGDAQRAERYRSAEIKGAGT